MCKKRPFVLLSDSDRQKPAICYGDPDGRQVVIHAQPELKPLPLLKGQMPLGWKDAIYHEEVFRQSHIRL